MVAKKEKRKKEKEKEKKRKKEKEETRNKNLFLFNLVGKKIKIFLLFNKEVVHIILYRRQGKNHEQQTGQERRQQ